MSKTAVLIITVLLIIITYAFIPSKAYAFENNTSFKNEKINPGSFYYSFKRGWEKFALFILFWPQSKLNYESHLLDIRMSEFKKIAEDKNLDEFQKASERVSFQAGVLTDRIINSKNEQDKQQLVDRFNSLSKVLSELRDLYPANSSFWLLTQQNVDTLKILSDRLQ